MHAAGHADLQCRARKLSAGAQADQRRSKQIKNWTYDDDDGPRWPPANLANHSFDGARSGSPQLKGQCDNIQWFLRFFARAKMATARASVADIRQLGHSSLTARSAARTTSPPELSRANREVKRIHETRRVRVRPTSLVKHSWRVEKRLSHWWRVADECDVKKYGAWTPSRIRKQTACYCKSAESRSWSYKLASFSGFTVISIDEFPRKGSERARRRSSGPGSVPHLPNSHCHSFPLKKSTAWQNPRCSKSKFLAVERDKVLPRCPKSTLSKIRRCQKKKV